VAGDVVVLALAAERWDKRMKERLECMVVNGFGVSDGS
jgi:hypothetical protein